MLLYGLKLTSSMVEELRGRKGELQVYSYPKQSDFFHLNDVEKKNQCERKCVESFINSAIIGSR